MIINSQIKLNLNLKPTKKQFTIQIREYIVMLLCIAGVLIVCRCIKLFSIYGNEQ